MGEESGFVSALAQVNCYGMGSVPGQGNFACSQERGELPSALFQSFFTPCLPLFLSFCPCRGGCWRAGLSFPFLFSPVLDFSLLIRLGLASILSWKSQLCCVTSGKALSVSVPQFPHRIVVRIKCVKC